MSEQSPEQLAERAADGVITAVGALARPWLVREFLRTFGAAIEDGESDEAIERKAEELARRLLSQQKCPRQQRPQSPRRGRTKRSA